MLKQELKKEFYNFIFVNEDERLCFFNYQDPRFSLLKNQQIKSLFIEFKESKWDNEWRNFIDEDFAVCLGNYESYLTQAYQKHIHNLTKKFVNLEGKKPTFWISERSLLINQEKNKFVDEHRENQYKVINHIRKNIKTMGWMEFFNLMDEARKCNIVTTSENSKLQSFQKQSKVGDWKKDYVESGLKVLNLYKIDDVLKFVETYKEEKQIILGNLKKLRKRNFSGTSEILDKLISIISKQ